MAERIASDAENDAEQTARNWLQDPATCVTIAVAAAIVVAQPELATLVPALF